MKAEIIKIGNSRGLRIPKTILKKYNLKHEVESIVKNNQLLIKALPEKRANWEEALQKIHNNKDQTFSDWQHINNSWDEDEWQW